MRSLFAGLLLAFCSLWVSPSAAVGKPSAIVLVDQATAFEAADNLLVWIEPGRVATIDQVAWAPGKFVAAGPETQHALDAITRYG